MTPASTCAAPFRLALILLITACGSAEHASAQSASEPADPYPEGVRSESVHVASSDGVTLHGDLYDQSSAVTILLFHQGGSNVRGEYAPIIPRLLEEGYRVLAFDLRRGGQLHGSWNRTVADAPGAGSYCEVEQDVETAVGFARGRWPDSRIVLWGSSYSAALVIRQAGRDSQGIAAVLAFSPASGEPMEGCMPEPFFDRVDVPVVILRPPNEARIPGIQEQLRLAREAGIGTIVPKLGSHGSSMLVEERVRPDPEWPGGAPSEEDVASEVAATWAGVLGFVAESTR